MGVSFIGSEKEKKDSFSALQKAAGYIHHKLARKSLLKYAPEIKFEYDDMPELRVEEILKEISTDREG